MTRHSAFCPQAPRQGSAHLLRMQALLKLHSLFVTHSGRQYGGEPEKPGWQVQDGASFITWHIELGPHGVGSQGVLFDCGSPTNILLE